MKLLLCVRCEDVRKFGVSAALPATCNCGAVSAWYEEDGHHGTITGEGAEAIGLANNMLVSAVRNTDPKLPNYLRDVKAWVFDYAYHRIIRLPAT